MDNKMYNFGKLVKDYVSFWDVEIEDGIDNCLEILLEEKEEYGIEYDGMFSDGMMDRGSKLLLDIKNSNYSYSIIGNMVYNFFRNEM